MPSSRAALPPRIARRSESSRPVAPSINPIGSISPISAGIVGAHQDVIGAVLRDQIFELVMGIDQRVEIQPLQISRRHFLDAGAGVGPRRGGVVDAPGIGRQIAAAMRQHDLQPGIILQHPAEDQVMHRHRRVERVADHVREIVIAEAARLGEPVRMHEDEQPQLLDARPDRAEALGRQILAGDMRHDLDAAKAERFVQPVEFGDGEFGRLERHRAEPDEAVRILAADLGDEVVDRARGRRGRDRDRRRNRSGAAPARSPGCRSPYGPCRRSAARANCPARRCARRWRG